MYTNYLGIVLVGLVLLPSAPVAGNPIKYLKCENVTAMAKLNSVDITPCPKQPCIFHKGTSVNATMTFIPDAVIDGGTLKISAIIEGKIVPYPLPNPDPCKRHNLDCPLKEGKEVSLELSLPVERFYPTINVVVEMAMLNEKENYVFCFEFPIRIQFGKVKA